MEHFKNLVILIGVVLLGFIAWNAYDTRDTTTNTTKKTTTAEIKSDLPTLDRLVDDFPTAKSEYMGGCTEESASDYTYCNCTYEYLDRNLTNSEFMRTAIDIGLEDGEFANEFWNAVEYCL